jgi:hypothetical protein
MSATMATQGGRVQLEQSNMRLVFNMAKMAEEGFSRAAIEEMKYLMKKPPAEVREEKKWGVEVPGLKKVKAAIQRHLEMLCQNQMSCCLPSHIGTTKNLHSRWRCRGTAAPPPARRREPTPHLNPPTPGLPTTPTGNTSGTQTSEIVNLPAGYTSLHTAQACAECFDDDQDAQDNTDFDPDMLTDEGQYTICCVVMWLTFILKTRVAD